MTKAKRTNIDRLYPQSRKLEWRGEIVNISPLKIKHLPSVAPAFGALFSKASALKEQGKTDSEIVSECFPEIVSILQPCVDKSLEDLPSALVPDLVLTFFEQNLSSDVLGKWMALGQTLVSIIGPRASEEI